MSDNSTVSLKPPPGTKDADVVLVSRQPIYGLKTELFAYALVYRSDVVESALLAKGEQASPEAFLNTFLDVGLETLVGESLAFVNVNRVSILRDYCRALPPERVVLGLPGEIEPDSSVVRSLMELKESGYTFALDDFGSGVNRSAVLELANYVIVNFERFTREEIAGLLPPARQFKGKLVAKGLGSQEQFDFARNLGFEYFRGPWLTRPKAVKATRIPINRLSTLQLVLKLQEPDLSTSELERVVGQDVTLSLRLLQYVNSASLSLARNIESIKHAIQLVGTQRIRLWSSLLLLTKLDDRPPELITTALVRATMAERLAMALDVPHPESYFMIGLFSLVDALLNLPMAEAIEVLPFSKPICEALVHRIGPMGSVLSCILAYEQGIWKDVRCGSLPLATIRQCYLEAVSATREMPKVSAQ